MKATYKLLCKLFALAGEPKKLLWLDLAYALDTENAKLVLDALLALRNAGEAVNPEHIAALEALR